MARPDFAAQRVVRWLDLGAPDETINDLTYVNEALWDADTLVMNMLDVKCLVV